MPQWASVDDILDFAIAEEQAAVQFYTRLADRTDNPAMREALQGFAQEERAHKDRLLAIRAGGAADLHPAPEKIADLKIADYLVDVEPTPDMLYDDALVLAMKKEQAACTLYTDLAARTDEAALKDVFLALAQEEARHKLRFETEYDDMLTDN